MAHRTEGLRIPCIPVGGVCRSVNLKDSSRSQPLLPEIELIGVFLSPVVLTPEIMAAAPRDARKPVFEGRLCLETARATGRPVENRGNLPGLFSALSL